MRKVCVCDKSESFEGTMVNGRCVRIYCHTCKAWKEMPFDLKRMEPVKKDKDGDVR